MKLINLLLKMGWSFEVNEEDLYFIDCNQEIHVNLKNDEEVTKVYRNLLKSTGFKEEERFNTIYQSVLNVQKHYEDNRDSIKWGLLRDEEVEFISKELSLKDKDLIQLQDIRDFVVMYLHDLAQSYSEDENYSKESMFILDMMSAIVCVIDKYKMNLGGRI